jgi:cysteine desulfurase / selenocysteine lyase
MVTMDSLIDPGEYSALSGCTYLNQASLGLIPRTSLAASIRFLTDVAQHGNLHLSDQAEAEILSTLRTSAAGLFGAPVASVAVLGGATEGLGQLAAMLSGSDGEVILVTGDFPSVTYPWLAARDRSGMRIRWVRDVAAEDLTLSLVDAINERTTVVCVSAVQFATGTLVDVAALVARARSVGARVVVDVTQMAGAVPVAMSEWGADALVCSGYKWLSAPGGVALLAITEDLAAAIPPLVGWKGSATPFDFKPQELALAADARRFELSTISYSAAAGLLTSIKLLTGTGLAAIRQHASRLAADLVERTAPLGWAPYRPLGDRSASGHIVSLRHPTAVADEVQAALAREHRIITSSRGGRIRVSLHAYNCADDVRALSEALEAASRGRRKPEVPRYAPAHGRHPQGRH